MKKMRYTYSTWLIEEICVFCLSIVLKIKGYVHQLLTLQSNNSNGCDDVK